MPELLPRRRLDQPREPRGLRFSIDPDAFGQFSERLARFLGTGKFLFWQTMVVVAWITVNLVAVSLRWDFAAPGCVDFLPAGRQGPAYAELVSTFDWANFYERLRGGAFLNALQADMRANYDYVLIDSRTGMSDTAGICTVHLPDIVVDCFTLSSQSIDGAAQVAHTIRAQRGDRPIVLLPVPMRVEDAEQLKLEAGRDYARQRCEELCR